MRRYAAWLIAILALAASFAACGDDSPTGSGSFARVTGTVFSLPDSSPVQAKVVIVDGSGYTVVGGPATTNNSGRFAVNNLPGGSFFLFVFTNAHLMFEPTAAQVTLVRGQTLERDVALIPAIWGNAPFKISGIVTDALTRRPVAGAFVSQGFSATWNGYQGISLPWECVTGADGRYQIDLIFAFNAPLDTVPLPVAASAEGYDSYISMPIDPPAPPDSVVRLDITLTQGGPTGGIRGRVLVDSLPVEGVPVALDYFGDLSASSPSHKSGRSDELHRVPVMGKTAVSDANGEFMITELTPGYYGVDPAYLPDDGYVGTFVYRTTVAAGEVADVGDVEVIRSFNEIAPLRGSRTTDTTPTFEWESVRGVAYYALSISIVFFFNGTNVGNVTQYELPASFLRGSNVRWFVTAYDANDVRIARFETFPTFSIVDSLP